MIFFLLLSVGFIGAAFLAFPFVRDESWIIKGLCIASASSGILSMAAPFVDWWLK